MKIQLLESMDGENKTVHYAYVCQKTASADQKCKDNFGKVMKELEKEYEEECKYN